MYSLLRPVHLRVHSPSRIQPFSSSSIVCIRARGRRRGVVSREEEEQTELAGADDTRGQSWQSEDEKAQPEEDDALQELTARTYEEFLRGEGRQFQYPDPLGPKWLGGDVPFPLNPTFRPPPPMSDALRNTIYRAYTRNNANLHALSSQYGISIDRLSAVIRLKDLEAKWKSEDKELQTGFLIGMEAMLGVRPGGRDLSISDEINSYEREEVRQADRVAKELTEESKGGKKGLTITYFESVDEGEQPVLPRLLEERHLLRAANTEVVKHNYPEQVVQPVPNRPAWRFVDVGLKWYNEKEAEKRAKSSAHRKAVKQRKHGNEKGEPLAAASKKRNQLKPELLADASSQGQPEASL